MLSNIYRQHTERVTVLKQKQGSFHFLNYFILLIIYLIEKKKKELLTSSEQLTRLVLDGLNNE
jgi:hypothetical protein